MPRPRERVYTLDKQKKHLARLSLLSAKRFRFNVTAHQRRVSDVWCRRLFALLSFQIPDSYDAVIA